eukprot:TRINITY_DN7802_c0_g1_i1.p1 TRINITY_DN7802_c0_g1~~TRINITY_DN7802_c0_g1_i1.p1  ORF type:complete len:282 (-),score=60.50 TRINITY_DN7802_c0_g1_i1:31-876(-)
MSFYFEDGENGLWESEFNLGCGVTVRIEENWNNDGSIGSVQWGNGVKLAQHLCTLKSLGVVRDYRNERVIELGAGLGVVSIAAAKLGAQVLATDLPIALPDIATNAQVNGLVEQHDDHRSKHQQFHCEESSGMMHVCALGWGDEANLKSEVVQNFLPATMVIAAACLYSAEAVDIFFDIIIAISDAKATRIILSGVIGQPPCTRFKQIWKKYFSYAVMLKNEEQDEEDLEVLVMLHSSKRDDDNLLPTRSWDGAVVLTDLECEEATGWELATLYLIPHFRQ